MTKALIFAAGFGKRLAPLTNSLPKPLMSVGGKSLIQYHIEKLVAAGVTDLVINTHWLADKLVDALGDGSAFGAHIQWSHEPEILDTGGAMKNALPLLGETPFLLVSADIWTDYLFENLLGRSLNKAEAHLVMVANPDQHRQGDFSLDQQGRLVANTDTDLPRYTYSGIGLFKPEFIRNYVSPSKVFPLREPLKAAMACGKVTAELFEGEWQDVGTPQRLQALQQQVSHSKCNR